jgi:hypothetical protein
MDDSLLEAPFFLEECDEEAFYHAVISSLIPLVHKIKLMNYLLPIE